MIIGWLGNCWKVASKTEGEANDIRFTKTETIHVVGLSKIDQGWFCQQHEHPYIS